MFFIMLVSNNPRIGLVLNDYMGEFSTYKEAKDEVDRLYKQSSSDRPYGLVVGAFIVTHRSDGGTEIVYSSVRQNTYVCPVCGKDARVLKASTGPVEGKWYGFCKECGLRTGFYDTIDEAKDVWMKISGNGGEWR